MATKKTIAVIGSGNMGSAIAKNLSKRKLPFAAMTK